jgi:ERCC4-type nuclease
MQLANGEFDGVDLICTRSRWDTVKFLIHQLEEFRKSFNPRRPPAKTRVELKNHINEQMKASTFMEYLRLRSIPGIGDAKAMKVRHTISFNLFPHVKRILNHIATLELAQR